MLSGERIIKSIQSGKLLNERLNKKREILRALSASGIDTTAQEKRISCQMKTVHDCLTAGFYCLWDHENKNNTFVRR